jgi:hypothetical protein
MINNFHEIITEEVGWLWLQYVREEIKICGNDRQAET